MPDQTTLPPDDSTQPEALNPSPTAQATVAHEATDGAGQADAAASAESTAAELAALRTKVTELTDHALRAQAEVQNVRRRTEEEVAKVRKFALESFAGSLLAVVDSLEAALKVENATTEQLREGTVATHQQLMSALEKNGVTEINPAPGAKFDPAQEHAISTVSDSGYDAGAIVAVLQKGYLIAERVLRPALVTVAASQ